MVKKNTLGHTQNYQLSNKVRSLSDPEDFLFLFSLRSKKEKKRKNTDCQVGPNVFIHFACLSFPLLSSSRSLSGPTPNSPTLATLSGDLPTPFNITTSGHQFLVRWSSDHGTNKKGFKIRYVGEYQSMYPNFTLLLLYNTMHGNKERS